MIRRVLPRPLQRKSRFCPQEQRDGLATGRRRLARQARTRRLGLWRERQCCVHHTSDDCSQELRLCTAGRGRFLRRELEHEVSKGLQFEGHGAHVLHSQPRAAPFDQNPDRDTPRPGRGWPHQARTGGGAGAGAEPPTRPPDGGAAKRRRRQERGVRPPELADARPRALRLHRNIPVHVLEIKPPQRRKGAAGCTVPCPTKLEKRCSPVGR